MRAIPEACLTHSCASEPLRALSAPCSFSQWGIDIVGSFPAAAGHHKFLFVAVDYFSKWVEAKPLARVTKMKIQHYEQENNGNLLRANLDLVDEIREDARTHLERYKQRIVNAYNCRVRKREFQVGDLVLRRVGALGPVGKLAPNWEGPYKITQIIKFGAYELEDIDGRKLSKTWNACSLRKFYS
ncbi:UNVERIFIED_CONTAM: hypothetical protein Slati_3782200 [Sesamum latifolium]|uniref:Reverse transcriptase domain-containing protein n=1 Tax=Sesamum latifolium TaxID=2727402 RepID=A0AAW2U3T8_9LAMI